MSSTPILPHVFLPWPIALLMSWREKDKQMEYSKRVFPVCEAVLWSKIFGLWNILDLIICLRWKGHTVTVLLYRQEAVCPLCLCSLCILEGNVIETISITIIEALFIYRFTYRVFSKLCKSVVMSCNTMMNSTTGSFCTNLQYTKTLQLYLSACLQSLLFCLLAHFTVSWRYSILWPNCYQLCSLKCPK